MGWVRRQANRQPGGRWPGWLATSGLLHVVLLGVLALLPGAEKKSPSALRIHVVKEFQSVPSWSGAMGTPLSSVLPSAILPHSSGARPPPVPGPSDARGFSGGTLGAMLNSSPNSIGFPEGSASPGGTVGEVPRFHTPTEPDGGMEVHGTAPQPGPPGPPSGPGPASVATQQEARTPAIIMTPAESGGGMGTGGLRVVNRGAGGGGAARAGQGGRGEGSGGSGRSGGGRGGTGVASRTGESGGDRGVGGDGLSDLLRAIRRQIEQTKNYPEAARREGIQGTVDLRFRIAADGSVEAIEILRSSGSQLLDEASRQTILRAAPYPRLSGWIRLPLSYRLDE